MIEKKTPKTNVFDGADQLVSRISEPLYNRSIIARASSRNRGK